MSHALPESTESQFDLVDKRPERSLQRLLVGVLLALSVVFIGVNASTMLARFGNSYDGFNAAVWSIGATSIEESGFVTSKFGGDNSLRKYANHPPAIYTATWLSNQIVPNAHLAARLVPLATSLAGIVVLTLLLLELGLSVRAIAGTLVIVMTAQMFVLYGVMLDTPILGFPIACAASLVLARTLNGKATAWWVAAFVGFASGLTSWTSVMFVGIITTVIAVMSTRRKANRLLSISLAAGLAAGLIVTLSWVWWVYGGLETLWSARAERTQLSVSSDGYWLSQWTYLSDSLPILGLLGCVGIVLSLVRPRVRVVGLIGLVSVVSYSTFFSEGASGHQYWNFLLIIPLAIGVAVLLDELWKRVRDSFVYRTLLIGCLFILGAFSLAWPSWGMSFRQTGIEFTSLYDVFESLDAGDDLPLALLDSNEQKMPYVWYETNHRTFGLPLKQKAVDEAVAADPALPVLVPNMLFAVYAPSIDDPAVDANLGVTVIGSAGGYSILAVEDLATFMNSREGG